MEPRCHVPASTGAHHYKHLGAKVDEGGQLRMEETGEHTADAA